VGYSISFCRSEPIVLPYTWEELAESAREHERAMRKTWARVITAEHASSLIEDGKAELREATVTIEGHEYGRLFRFDMLREDIFLMGKK
jgi:hypothetical protein